MSNKHEIVIETDECTAREIAQQWTESGDAWVREDHPHTGIDSDHIHMGCGEDRNTDAVLIYERGSGYDESESGVERTQQDDNPSGEDWHEYREEEENDW